MFLALKINGQEPCNVQIKRKSKNLFNESLLNYSNDNLTIKYLPEEECLLFNGKVKRANAGGFSSRYFTKSWQDINIDAPRQDYYTMSCQYISGSFSGKAGIGGTYSYRAGHKASDIFRSGMMSTGLVIHLEFPNTTNYTTKTIFGLRAFYSEISMSLNTVFDNYKVKIQLEKGSSATSHAPFSEIYEDVEIINIPSSTEDDASADTIWTKPKQFTNKLAETLYYPKNIVSETKDIQVQLSSKNILDPTLWSTASSGKGLTIQYLPDEDCFVANGTITPTSSETAADIGIKSVNIPINKGKKYTLSIKYVSGESEMSNLMFTCRDTLGSGGNQVISISPILDKQNHTTTNVINATAIKDVRFYFYMGGTTPKTVTNYKFRIQLEENPAATDYTSFVSDFSESKVYRYEKNLFDMRLLDPIGFYDLGSYKLTVDEVLDNGYIVQGNKGTTGKGDSSWGNGWFNPGGQHALKNKWGTYVPAGVPITWSYDVTLLEKPYYPDDDYSYTFRTVNRTTNQIQKPIKENISLTLNEKKHITVTGVNPTSGILTPQFTLNSNKLKIENIQLEIGNTDTGYIPFYDNENLFDINGITGCYMQETGEDCSSDGVKEDDCLNVSCGRGAKNLVWGTSKMHLKKGVYTISADCFFNAVIGANSYPVYMGVGTAEQSIGATVSVFAQYQTQVDAWTYVSASIEILEDGDYYLILQPYGNRTDFDVSFKNIQVKFSKTEYTPAEDGTVSEIKNLTPVTTLITDGSTVMDITK